MPQLNPTPWLAMLVFSWMVYMSILPIKVMAHSFVHKPTPKTAKEFKTQPWTWPW
uniref:ATP synthase complex subunit 8 n=2 Tax=Hoplichthys TaxID=270557 RepID=A0A1V1FT62_9TELE|nr:ATP synthase F0 subunit 8 [Hoplichthys gilberti]BAX03764.1 ATPase subunit 8 [Hoplichthys gilberti]BBM35061.1 ATPase subunit 8 [Hoplichthys fasciatus]BBU25726.1 ATPase subunit 8 [Hoplichthys gilberti]